MLLYYTIDSLEPNERDGKLLDKKESKCQSIGDLKHCLPAIVRFDGMQLSKYHSRLVFEGLLLAL